MLVDSKQQLFVLLLASQALGLAATGLSTYSGYQDHHTVDLHVYLETSRQVLDGKVPYRDFAIEYPPAAVVPLTAARLLMLGHWDSITAYRCFFLIVMALCSTGLALTVWGACASLPGCNQARSLGIYSLAVAILGPFLAWRFDLFPALLTGLALRAYLRGRAGAAGVLLGLGIAAKIYPLLLVPIFGAEALARRDHAAVVRLGIGVAAGLCAAVVPFAILSPGGVMRMFAYHADRGFEIGSLPAGLGLLWDAAGGANAIIDFKFGGVEVAFPGSVAILRIVPGVAGIMFLVTVAGAYASFRRIVNVARSTKPALITYLTLTLLAALATSKVVSPQYMAWLLPFAALLPLRHGLWFLTAGGLTTAVFPFQFVALLHKHAFAIVLLNVRNALLLAGAAWLLWELSRSAFRREPQAIGYQGVQDMGVSRE